MANVFLAAALLSGILAVSGCAGLVPGLEALGSLGGGNPSYGGGQAYPYNPGAGGGYAQQGQPYYQPQTYAYPGNVYQQGQPVQPYYQSQSNAYSGNPGVNVYHPAHQGYNASTQGRWIDRRQQGRIKGEEGRMRAHGNLSYQERARLNAKNRSNQGIYGQKYTGAHSWTKDAKTLPKLDTIK